MHWLDTETEGALNTLSENIASAQLLLLTNYRPESRHEWGGKTYYTQLRLTPLGKEEAEELLSCLLGNAASLAPLKPLILEKTEGTPFFMEEVVQTLAEDGALSGEPGHYRLETAPTELHISPTVQGVLAARIDRLTAAEKELLQQLSVIGRQFPVSLVHAVVSQTEDELHQILASLQAKEFLYEQPAFPESEYLFKHALTQDVAYGTVLHEQRKLLHERTGQARPSASGVSRSGRPSPRSSDSGVDDQATPGIWMSYSSGLGASAITCGGPSIRTGRCWIFSCRNAAILGRLSASFVSC